MDEPIYQRRDHTADNGGVNFEIDVAAWMLLRGLRRNSDFFLGCNVDGYGVFDDICFKYKYENEWHLMFMQLKYRQNDKKFDKLSVFNILKKCWMSYVDITNANSEEKEFLKGVENNNIHYIILTNGNFDDLNNLNQIDDKAIADYLASPDKVFQFCESAHDTYIVGILRKVAINDIKKSEINNCYPRGINLNVATKEELTTILKKSTIDRKYNETSIKSFLKKVIIAQNQPNNEIYNDLIFDEIIDVTNEDCQKVCKSFLKSMEKWHSDKEATTALSLNNFYKIFEKYDKDASLHFGRLINAKHFVPRTSILTLERSRPIILAGIAGCGKTVVMDHLCLEDVTNVKIDLSKCYKKIDKWAMRGKNSLNIQEGLQLCLEYGNPKKYEETLKFGKMIFIDAYDIVLFGAGIEAKELTDVFLKELHKKFNIMVSTRKFYETDLEDLEDFEGIVHNINELTLKDMKLMTKYFFHNQVIDINDENREKIIELYTDCVFNFISKWQHLDNLLTVPLHLRIILQLFLNNYKINGQMELDPKYDEVFNLIQEFVNEKINRYVKMIGINTPNEERKCRSIIYSDHYYYAIKYLENKADNEVAYTFQLAPHNLIQLGFVVFQNSQVAFIHRKFAEFFLKCGKKENWSVVLYKN